MPNLDTINVDKIRKISNKLRLDVIKMLTESQSGHTAGSLSAADIITTLYFHVLNIDPKNPKDPNRDRFILSNGHICPILYAALAEKGFFSRNELWKLRKIDHLLEGHPINNIPGVETSSGSLGQGLSQAIGIALAAKMDKKEYKVYCLSGDGELNEGQIWEAAMFAPKYKLNNLVWIIDKNNIQLSGNTQDIMPMENLRHKLESFNWMVIEIDGHNHEEIFSSLKMASLVNNRPTVIIAHTIPGKGVSFMEYKFEWHGKVPNNQQAIKAIKELESKL